MSELYEQLLDADQDDAPPVLKDLGFDFRAPRGEVVDASTPPAVPNCLWCGAANPPTISPKGKGRLYCRIKHAFYGSFIVWCAKRDAAEYERMHP